MLPAGLGVAAHRVRTPPSVRSGGGSDCEEHAKEASHDDRPVIPAGRRDGFPQLSKSEAGVSRARLASTRRFTALSPTGLPLIALVKVAS